MSETRIAPSALAYSTENCQIGRALAVLSEKGTFIVLREVFNGVFRFDDMQRHTGLSRQVLSNRLGLLVEHDILRRKAYRDIGARTRFEYRLTTKGTELYPIFAALSDWGTRYYAGPEGPAVDFTHRGCGGVVHPRLTCDAGHEISSSRDVITQPGAGARAFVST